MNGFTFDAGGLIALDRRDRDVRSYIAYAEKFDLSITIPATVLAQAIRNPARQSLLARLVRQPLTDVIALDREDAIAVGRLLAQTGTSDIADAHVVVCAIRAGQPVVTSDAGDLRRLAPTLQLISV